MINSLSKDSHITQVFRHSQKLQNSGNETGQNSKSNESRIVKYSIATENNSIGTIVRKPAEVSFSGFSNGNKSIPWVYRSKLVKNLLMKAEKNQVVYSAGFALLLTCLLRPASIMALPGNKKNADDKKYAAAHSIASGVIGFTISSIVANPISAGVEKLLKKPEDYMKKNATWLAQKSKNSIANNYLNKVPDILISVPKGIATVALIPVILKYVFGWEKKHPKEDKNSPSTQVAAGGVK